MSARPPAISNAPVNAQDYELEHARMRQLLREIRDANPTCSDAAQSIWSNRAWAGHYRDIQRKARLLLQEIDHGF